MKQLNRRSFLATTAASSLCGVLVPRSFGAEAAKAAPKALFDISLAQWSLHRRHFVKGENGLDNLDFAKTAADLDVFAIEYVNVFFKNKAQDEAYLGEMKKRADGVGVKSLLIMVDGEGRLGDPEEAARKKTVENHHKWVDAAKLLGCHSIRVNARSSHKLSFDEQMKLAADGLRQLSEYGAKQGLNVIVENHGGLSSNGAWLAGVMKMVDHERCGTLPDFGNFLVDRSKGEWYDRYKGVAEMMPFAKAVSAKSHEFRAESPLSTFGGGIETDYLKMMKIVLDAGYRGHVGIEFEGSGDEIVGIKKTRDLLIAVREKLKSEYA